MSRFQCPHCRTMHYTTSDGNEVEGYFITDRQACNRGPVADLETAISDLGIRAYHCTHCGVVTLEPGEERK